MDERETIPRREAAIGIGLLGLFTAALIGTVVFRIVQAGPQRGPQTTTTVWASQEPANVAGELDARAAPLAAEISPPAAPIPTIDDGASSVPVSSNVAPLEPMNTPADSPAPTSPHFVAPAGR